TENIFTLYNENGVRGGNVDRTWNTIAHYNMNPGGWNGWCTLSDYYDKFAATDERGEYITNTPRTQLQIEKENFVVKMLAFLKANNTIGQRTNRSWHVTHLMHH